MNKLVKIALILVVTGVIAAGLIWKFYVNQPHEDIDSATAAYSLSTSDIWSQYTTNRKVADSLYNNKVIEITGALSRVDKNDSLVSIVFVMAADSMFGDKTINCQMYKKHNDDAASLAKGANVKIKGVCVGFDDTDIKFNKCSLVK
ncbi:MAG: hypothetical protein WCR72_08225 [Bacteroidota bacterium]